MGAVVSFALPQEYVVSPVYNFHFFLCVLLQVYPVRRQLSSTWSMNCHNLFVISS